MHQAPGAGPLTAVASRNRSGCAPGPAAGPREAVQPPAWPDPHVCVSTEKLQKPDLFQLQEYNFLRCFTGTQFRKPATEVAPEARLWFQYPPAAVPPTGLCSRAHEPTRQEGAGAQGIRASGPPRGRTALKLHVPAPVGTHVTLGPPAWRSPCPDGHSLVAGLFSKLAFCPSPSPHLLLLLCLLRPPVLSGDLSCPLRCLRSSASCFPGQLNQNPGGGFRH